MARALVTGGGGFIGAVLVRRLVAAGWEVVCLDDMTRGDAGRLAPVAEAIELVRADVRDAEALTRAARGAEVMFHLAAVNGTENFYRRPELVLDVGLRGALAAVEACRRADVPDLVAASSAEVYQTPAHVPTGEDVALTLPDSLNPRYSYGGSKIATELIAFNYAREHFRKVQVFRPHNVYGPDMGWKHVIPQLLLRAFALAEAGGTRFAIQGTGAETRAFAYVEDVVDGILLMQARGEHRAVYHIGADREIAIRDLARMVCESAGIAAAEIVPGPGAEGGTPRRCPDIARMRALGYAPRVDLAEGLARTAAWYRAHGAPPDNALM